MKARARSSAARPARQERGGNYGTGYTRATALADLPELLTVEESADAIDASAWTVRELVRRGELEASRFGRLIRIHRDGLRPKAR